MKEKKPDQQSLLLMSKVSDFSVDFLKEVFESYFRASCFESELIDVHTVMDQLDCSYSTLRRRLTEHGINLVPLPGWKVRKAIDRVRLESALGIKLEVNK